MENMKYWSRRVGDSVYAFTLPEILVVCGILVVLAALLTPVFVGVRNNARTRTCASNLNQIALALSQYTQDHSQRYPLIPKNTLCTWADAVFPYVKSTQIFRCPAAKYGEYVSGCGAGETIPGNLGYTDGKNGSYDLVNPFIEVHSVEYHNGTAGGVTTDITIQDKSLRTWEYRYPATTILVLDGQDITLLTHSQYAVVNPGIDPIHSVDDLKDGGVLAVHGAGLNLMYADGHIKWHRLDDLTSTPMWRYDGKEPTPAPTPPAP